MHMSVNLGMLLAVHFQHVAGGHHKDILLGNPQLADQTVMGQTVMVFAVNRNGISGMYQRIEQLDLLLAGMSRYMGVLVNHVRPTLRQLVNDLSHGLFIAGNGI